MKILISFDLPERYLREIRSISPRVHVEKYLEKEMLLKAVKDVEILYAGLFNKDILMASG